MSLAIVKHPAGQITIRWRDNVLLLHSHAAVCEKH